MLTDFKEELATSQRREQPRAGSSRRTIPLLVAAVVVLAAAVVAMGLVLLWPDSTSDAEARFDRVNDAWNTGDTDALRSLYTDNAVLWSGGNAPSSEGVDEILAEATAAASIGFRCERTGSIVELGNLMVVPAHCTANTDVNGDDAFLVSRWDDGKIAENWVIWST